MHHNLNILKDPVVWAIIFLVGVLPLATVGATLIWLE
jgi:hypothetical protein